ncbi:MAG: hypothetical protein B7X54_02305 [Idiomarina sp. 34-48-12]|nr:MAG: hypothetical protein B7X54_02305 [Idiomarina sp. 34-48-12]
MIDWCITGWRQQSSKKTQILEWLADARRLGFERYGLIKQGHHYWLCCCNDADYDLAIYVREQVNVNAAVFVQQEQSRLICVAWNGDTLLGASQFATDTVGIKSLFCITQHWLAADGMRCSLVIAGRGLREILEAQLTNDITIIEVDEINFSDHSTGSKLRSIRRSPFWLKRQIFMAVGGLLLSMTAAFSWSYLPQSMNSPVVKSLPSPELIKSTKPLWLVTQLGHVNALLNKVNYLAGWQVQRWQLSEQGEQLWLQPTYGTKPDLLAQIPNPSEWRWLQRGSSIYIERELPAPLTDSPSYNSNELSLEHLGFSLTRTSSRIIIKHTALDTSDGKMWQALSHWLIDQSATTQIRSAGAEANGFFWSISIELETTTQGTQR